MATKVELQAEITRLNERIDDICEHGAAYMQVVDALLKHLKSKNLIKGDRVASHAETATMVARAIFGPRH